MTHAELFALMAKCKFLPVAGMPVSFDVTDRATAQIAYPDDETAVLLDAGTIVVFNSDGSEVSFILCEGVKVS